MNHWKDWVTRIKLAPMRGNGNERCRENPRNAPATAYGLRLLLVFFVAGLVFVAPSAHADFRKALDALINKDGKVMLAEVRDAVEKRNDNGIVLFVSVLAEDVHNSRQQSFYWFGNGEDFKRRSSWQTALTPIEQDELINLLQEMADDSSLQAQYRLLYLRAQIGGGYEDFHKPLRKLSDLRYSPAAYDLVWKDDKQGNRDEYLKGIIRRLHYAAELGNAAAELELAQYYIHFLDSPLNIKPADYGVGLYWLKRAIAQASPANLPLGMLGATMGKLYETGTPELPEDPYQAYLWHVFGVKNMGYDSIPSLISMRDAGKLTKIGQAYTGVDDLLENEVPSPNLLLQQRMQPADSPWLSINRFASEPRGSFGYGYQLEIYPDGRVNFLLGSIQYGEENKEQLLQLSPAEMKKLAQKIDAMDIQHWQSSGTTASLLDGYPTIKYNVTIHLEGSYRIVAFANPLFTKAPQYVRGEGMGFAHKRDSANLAKLLTMLEEFVPTLRMRCISESKTFFNECMSYEGDK